MAKALKYIGLAIAGLLFGTVLYWSLFIIGLWILNPEYPHDFFQQAYDAIYWDKRNG